MAPWRAAAARSAGSGDQPSTRAIPARLADSATEPPIAPSPMTPSVWGRTAWKLVGPDGGVNADAPRPADGMGTHPPRRRERAPAGAPRRGAPARPHVEEGSPTGPRGAAPS